MRSRRRYGGAWVGGEPACPPAGPGGRGPSAPVQQPAGSLKHRLQSPVSHVRGPLELLTFGGCPIVTAIPVSVGEAGNGTAYFQVLSYAGTVTISVLTDPDHFPELDSLAAALRAELDLISPGCATRH